MRNRHLPIVVAAAIALLYQAAPGHAENNAARDALLGEAERLYAAWESPASGDGTVTCRVNAIAALPDGSLLAALSPDPIDHYYGDDVPQIVRLAAEDGTRTGLSFGRGFTLLAVDGGQGYAAAANRDTVVLFPVDDPESVEDQWDNAAQNSALVFLSDGGMLATGGRNAYVHVLRTGGEILDLPLPGHAATVTAVASAGGLLFSASADGTVKVWDPAAGQLRKTIRPDGGRIVGLQPGAGGRSLSVILADGTGIVYHLASYKAAATWKTGIEAVSLCAFSRDGGLAALYDGMETAVVWDLARSRETERVSVMAGGERTLTAVAFTADGGRLVLGWSDGALSARVLESKVQDLLSQAGLTEAQRNSWLGERRLAAGDAAGAAQSFLKAGDPKGIARAGRVLLDEGAADAAETLFRVSADKDGLALTGRYFLEHGAWEAAQRCLADTQGRAAAATAVGDACFDAQAFQDALGYYVQAADANRLSKLAQVLFVRKDYQNAAAAYLKAGDKAGLRRAADALFAGGSQIEAARILLNAGEKSAVSALATSLLAAKDWAAAGEICALIKDETGARKAAAALQEAGEARKVFTIYLALGDRTAARKVADGLVAEGGKLFRTLESYKDLPAVSQKLGESFSLAAELYAQGEMKDEVTASIPGYVKNYDYIFPLVWYSTFEDRPKFKEVVEAAYSLGVLIPSLMGYSWLQDKEGVGKVAQALMRNKRFDEAAEAFQMLDDTAGRNAAAAALMAAGNAEAAEAVYRETGDKAGLTAAAAAARKAGRASAAAELYALAGDAAAVYAVAAETERKSGPAAALDQYALIADSAILKREAARLIEAGYYTEARRLLETADDKAGLAALAERYAGSGLYDEAVEIYTSLGDTDAADRIGRKRDAAARPGTGQQAAAESAESRKKRAAAALGRKDFQEAGEAYGQLGDYAGFLRVIKACLTADAYYGGVDTALALARQFSYKPAFAAIAEAAEREAEYQTADESYREAGDREALRSFAQRLMEADASQASIAIGIYTFLGDKEGLDLVARAVLTYADPFDSSFDEHYESIVAGLGDETAAKLAEVFLADGSFRFPIAWFAGKKDDAGLARCAKAVLEAGDGEPLAAALYARIGDRQGLARVAEAVLGNGMRWDTNKILARAIYRKLGDKSGLTRCAASALVFQNAMRDTDFRDAALLYREAGDAAGMLSVAEAYAKADRPVLAARWADLAGDAKRAAAYRKGVPQGAGVRIRLEAEQTTDIEPEGDMAPVWWYAVVDPVEAGPDETAFAAGIRLSLEADGFVVVGDAEGAFDYALALKQETREADPEADRISFQINAATGQVLLEVSDEGMDTEGHALIADLPAVVRQFLAE